MHDLITLLSIQSDLEDAREALAPTSAYAAGLLDRAHRLVNKATHLLALHQWDFAVDAEIDAEGFELVEGYPIALPLPGRARTQASNGNGHPRPA